MMLCPCHSRNCEEKHVWREGCRVQGHPLLTDLVQSHNPPTVFLYQCADPLAVISNKELPHLLFLAIRTETCFEMFVNAVSTRRLSLYGWDRGSSYIYGSWALAKAQTNSDRDMSSLNVESVIRIKSHNPTFGCLLSENFRVESSDLRVRIRGLIGFCTPQDL